MTIRAAVGAALVMFAGCGGAASPGGSGGNGSGLGGGRGAGSGGTIGGGGTSGGLPACAVVTRPDEPDAGLTEEAALSGLCNSISLTGVPVVDTTMISAVDGGIELDGGAFEGPTGGSILDGDYEMTSWMGTGPGSTQRAIRVFGGGTHIEWAVQQPDVNQDGGVLDIRYDSTAVIDGHTLTFTYVCGGGIDIPSFDYAASGNQLTFFDFSQTVISGVYAYVSVDAYQRTCARP
jgi:hypothetical protein